MIFVVFPGYTRYALTQENTMSLSPLSPPQGYTPPKVWHSGNTLYCLGPAGLVWAYEPSTQEWLQVEDRDREEAFAALETYARSVLVSAFATAQAAGGFPFLDGKRLELDQIEIKIPGRDL